MLLKTEDNWPSVTILEDKVSVPTIQCFAKTDSKVEEHTCHSAWRSNILMGIQVGCQKIASILLIGMFVFSICSQAGNNIRQISGELAISSLKQCHEQCWTYSTKTDAVVLL